MLLSEAYSLIPEIIILSMKLIKDLILSFVIFYNSVYLIVKDIKQQEKQKNNLGTKAIENFEVAMKSQNVLYQFRKYINEHQSHYKDELFKVSSGERKINPQMSKMGVNYLLIFHLITIFNSLNF